MQGIWSETWGAGVVNSVSGDIDEAEHMNIPEDRERWAEGIEAGNIPSRHLSRSAWQDGDQDPDDRWAGRKCRGNYSSGSRHPHPLWARFWETKNFQCKILISSCCSVEKLKSILPSMERMGYRGSKIWCRCISMSSMVFHFLAWAFKSTLLLSRGRLITTVFIPLLKAATVGVKSDWSDFLPPSTRPLEPPHSFCFLC